MALIKCPDCGKMFSDHAEKCPACGCTIEHVKEFERQKTEEERERRRKEEEERLRKIEEKRAARKAYIEKNKGKIFTCAVVALLCVSGITYWAVDSRHRAIAHAEMLIENALDSLRNLKKEECSFVYRDSQFKKIFYGGGKQDGSEGLLMVYEPVLNESGDIMERIDTLYDDYYAQTENSIESPDSLHLLIITQYYEWISLLRISRESSQCECIASEEYGEIWLEGNEIIVYESKCINEDAFNYEHIYKYRKKCYDLNGELIYEDTEWHDYDEVAEAIKPHCHL